VPAERAVASSFPSHSLITLGSKKPEQVSFGSNLKYAFFFCAIRTKLKCPRRRKASAIII
jgi:hypothetical protein